MNLLNYYWYFQKVIPHKICDEIISYGKFLKERENLARTGEFSKRDLEKNPLSKKEINNLKKTRNSNIIWMNERWIYKEIQPYVEMANKNAGWNFDVNSSEFCQFTKYSLNQHYEWHQDCWEKPYENTDPFLNGKVRKLSVTVNLSNPDDYEGGQLEFDFKNNNPNKKNKPVICEGIAPKGSLVVFPSFVWHRVKPVTKGVRYSLVIWNLGYPFK
jgi:PKHD-type hydroxylase